MLILGPVGEGARRAQCQKWLAFLDAACLEWWRVEGHKTSIKVARARMEGGELPPVILEKACHEGMRRVATIYPYVLWGPGPWDAAPIRRVVGLWPCKRRIMRAITRHVVGVIGEPPGTMGVAAHIKTLQAARKQRYWLVVGEQQYRLLARYGTGIWCMKGRWSHVDV